MIFNPIKRAGVILLPAITALALTGCWTPHNANVQPAGEPRLIQGGIPVDAVKNHATVEAIAAGQRRISLKLSDGTLVSCPVGPQVKDLAQVQAGDKVKVTLAQELTVYVLKDGSPGIIKSAKSRRPGANVASMTAR